LLENRKVFLNLITMLVNFRTCHIGLDQLKSTFYPKFEAVGDDQVCNLHRSVQIWGIDFGQLAIGLTWISSCFFAAVMLLCHTQIYV
jgi:hypothetical protein